MNAQELLENTEKCIGTEEMIKQHEELKQLHKQYVERERSMNAVSSRLSDEEQRNSRISVDVENIAEKRNMLQMIEKLKQKRAWLHYDIYRKKVYEVIAPFFLHAQFIQ
ncbi:hypothetical protein C0J52_14674 [Blattella germanica]|nr:hypothetical protein C0J52_14674 [Blattella germanica]